MPFVQTVPLSLLQCPHGIVRGFHRCLECEAKDAEDLANQTGPLDRATRHIEACIALRRRWFDRCAFCSPIDERRHLDDCPWLAFIATAYVKHAVDSAIANDPIALAKESTSGAALRTLYAAALENMQARIFGTPPPLDKDKVVDFARHVVAEFAIPGTLASPNLKVAIDALEAVLRGDPNPWHPQRP